jgi:hypothetical protein
VTVANIASRSSGKLIAGRQLGVASSHAPFAKSVYSDAFYSTHVLEHQEYAIQARAEEKGAPYGHEADLKQG